MLEHPDIEADGTEQGDVFLDQKYHLMTSDELESTSSGQNEMAALSTQFGSIGFLGNSAKTTGILIFVNNNFNSGTDA